VTEITERAKQFANLWAMLMPDTALPPTRTILIWLSSFTDSLIEGALAQAARVAEKYNPQTEEELIKLHKFISTRLRITRENERAS
jgi:hypothetical protein